MSDIVSLDAFLGSQVFQQEDRIELHFRTAEGGERTLSLPIPAMLGLKAIVEDLEAGHGRLAAPAANAKVVKRCSIGRSNDQPLVLLAINEETPFAFQLDDAKSVWREMRKETETVETMMRTRR